MGGGESEIAGTQADHAVGQAQALQYGFGVAREYVEGIARLVGMGQLNQLHLVELMEPDETADVFAIGPRFGSETGRERAVPDGKALLFEDLAAVEVGQLDLGGR